MESNRLFRWELGRRELPLCAAVLMIMGLLSASAQTSSRLKPNMAPGSPMKYPLKASDNGRYLVDQNNTPVFLVGDAPQNAFALLDRTQWTTYLADRQTRGVNIVWVLALCSQSSSINGTGLVGCHSSMQTYDGIAPFKSGNSPTTYDISAPNGDYWSRVDDYINLAGSHGITVLFCVWDTSGLEPLMEASGSTKMYNFGVFLGNRYKKFPNIIWMSGVDFQNWRTDSTDNILLGKLMAGIASVDKSHLQTTELDFNRSKSLDDSLLAPYTTLNGVYDYYCDYGEVYAAYNAAAVPVFVEEGYYENATAQNWTTALPATTAEILRRQEWWSSLAGACGYIYGNMNIWPFVKNWQNDLDSVGITQFGYLASFMKRVAWYNLVPDQRHIMVTAGYGTPNLGIKDKACIIDNGYATTAYFADRSGSVSYMPVNTTLTVAMSQFSGPVNAKWFDPTKGTYSTIPGSPLSNSGERTFATPGKNSAGTSDWVLLIESADFGP